MAFRLPTGARPPPESVPLFPLPVLLLPRSTLHLNIFEPRYLALTDYALGHGRLIGMVQPKADEGLDAPKAPIYSVGCVGTIVEFSATNDGRYAIQLVGLSRYRILSEELTGEGFRLAMVDWSEFDGDAKSSSDEVEREALLEAIAHLSGKDLEGHEGEALRRADAEMLITLVTWLCPMGIAERQALIEAPELSERVSVLLSVVAISEAGGLQDDEGSIN